MGTRPRPTVPGVGPVELRVGADDRRSGACDPRRSGAGRGEGAVPPFPWGDGRLANGTRAARLGRAKIGASVPPVPREGTRIRDALPRAVLRAAGPSTPGRARRRDRAPPRARARPHGRRGRLPGRSGAGFGLCPRADRRGLARIRSRDPRAGGGRTDPGSRLPRTRGRTPPRTKEHPTTALRLQRTMTTTEPGAVRDRPRAV